MLRGKIEFLLRHSNQIKRHVRRGSTKMDAGTGEIYKIDLGDDAENHKQAFLDAIARAETEYGRKQIPLSEQQYNELTPMKKKARLGTMRNKPCVCGSGIKFKKCCWNKYT